MSKRLQTQRVDLEKQGFIVLQKSQNNWQINISGPKESPFAGGQFTIQLKLDNFPFKAPIFSFQTQIYHPNVSEQGQICPDMIETSTAKWSPTKRLSKVMQKIMNLLQLPNLDTPLNEKAAQDYKDGKWQKKAIELTKKYAK